MTYPCPLCPGASQRKHPHAGKRHILLCRPEQVTQLLRLAFLTRKLARIAGKTKQECIPKVWHTVGQHQCFSWLSSFSSVLGLNANSSPEGSKDLFPRHLSISERRDKTSSSPRIKGTWPYPVTIWWLPRSGTSGPRKPTLLSLQLILCTRARTHLHTQCPTHSPASQARGLQELAPSLHGPNMETEAQAGELIQELGKLLSPNPHTSAKSFDKW